MDEIKPFSEDISYGKETLSPDYFVRDWPISLNFDDAQHVLESVKRNRAVAHKIKGEKYGVPITEKLFKQAKKVVSELIDLETSSISKKYLGDLLKLKFSAKIPPETAAKSAAATLVEKKALFSKGLAEWVARHAGLRLTTKVLSIVGKFLIPAVNVLWTADMGWDAYKFLKARPAIMSVEMIKALKEGRVSEKDMEKVRTAFYLMKEKKMKPAEVQKVMEGFSQKNVIPYGEFYHKDKGWY